VCLNWDSGVRYDCHAVRPIGLCPSPVGGQNKAGCRESGLRMQIAGKTTIENSASTIVRSTIVWTLKGVTILGCHERNAPNQQRLFGGVTLGPWRPTTRAHPVVSAMGEPRRRVYPVATSPSFFEETEGEDADR
jgi:hypothetical protein